MSGSSSSEPVGVILAVDSDRFADVVEAARRIGLTVRSEQPIVGTLSGIIAEDRIRALRALDGVEAVDLDRPIDLPPPDSPVQ